MNNLGHIFLLYLVFCITEQFSVTVSAESNQATTLVLVLLPL